jgi:hypothetical protein
VDPLAFLGAHLVYESLAGLHLGIPGASLIRPNDRLAIRGDRPFGCLIELPGWHALDDPAFEDLIRRLHLRLETLASDLLQVFTGQRRPPLPWHRHPLRSGDEIARGLAGQPFSAGTRAGVLALSGLLRDLSASTAHRLRRADPPRRMDLMTLNQPCYALALHAPDRNRPGASLAAAGVVHLAIQPKLFSGIGGAGLLGLGGVPSVRILRGEGRSSVERWQHRSRFQRDFAQYNQIIQSDVTDIRFEPLNRFSDPRTGWQSATTNPRGRRL